MTEPYDAVSLARIVGGIVTKRTKEFYSRTFKRAIVSTVVSRNVCHVKIEGSDDETKNVICLGSYMPVVGDMVMVISIGTSGTDLIVVGPYGPPIGQWQTPSLNSPWTNVGGDWGVAQYVRDSQGWVHLRGSVDPAGGTTTIFTLPSGYRPPYPTFFPIWGDGGTYYLEVSAAGAVTTYNAAGLTYMSIVGVKFRVA